MSLDVFDVSGPSFNFTMRAGQTATIACTFPPEIVDWTDFVFQIQRGRGEPPEVASVDITNLAGDDKQVVFAFTSAQTRTLNPNRATNAASLFAIWAKDPNGGDAPLGSGIALVKPEVRQ